MVPPCIPILSAFAEKEKPFGGEGTFFSEDTVSIWSITFGDSSITESDNRPARVAKEKPSGGEGDSWDWQGLDHPDSLVT
jgi:hypothetical protein